MDDDQRVHEMAMSFAAAMVVKKPELNNPVLEYKQWYEAGVKEFEKTFR